ncbi:hypothetical protein [Haloferula rosea]|uniref:Uncharacterized protein n=1 Tax=Haloferula rosea TaxID=490093 RepID=A0A934RDD4_9BACT|nr:hypothetical protein [Haloferula rosea]MBK1826521.1 hypothetical protein [Haloferula rosea]
MDKEQARFVLRCFRPDGADADDKDFAAALQLAASDRELGEWLAEERAQDAAFSSALGRLELPDGLREEILAGLAVAQGQELEMDAYDGQMIGALAQITPPEGFRREILAAMEQSARPVAKPSRSWWRFGVPIAAAAGIALAVVMTRPDATTLGEGDQLTGRETYVSSVPISHVEQEAISTLTSPGFTLDLKNADQKVLFKFIREQGRACPEGGVPRGLEGIPGLGCRVLDVEGKSGAIVCFRKSDDEVVHLVVFRKGDVDCCDLKEATKPVIDQHGNWAVARWHDSKRVFLLLGKSGTDDLDKLF